jgi:hypothetical protein
MASAPTVLAPEAKLFPVASSKVPRGLRGRINGRRLKSPRGLKSLVASLLCPIAATVQLPPQGEFRLSTRFAWIGTTCGNFEKANAGSSLCFKFLLSCWLNLRKPRFSRLSPNGLTCGLNFVVVQTRLEGPQPRTCSCPASNTGLGRRSRGSCICRSDF